MTKKPRTCNGERTIFSINDAGKTGQPQAREWKETTILSHTQKLTQNGQKSWM